MRYLFGLCLLCWAVFGSAQVDSSQVIDNKGKKGKMSGLKADSSQTAKIDSVPVVDNQAKKGKMNGIKPDSNQAPKIDSPAIAKIEPQPKKPKLKTGLSPKQVLLGGFLLPGFGQVYNRKWWKLPIVYGGIGGIGYLMVNNYQNYKAYSRAYLYSVDNNPNTSAPNVNPNSLKSNRDQYRSAYERSLLLLVGFYALTAVDGFVDAHLKKFDMGDDISLQIKPNILIYNHQLQQAAAPALSLKFNF